jgi:hypothetical protein
VSSCAASARPAQPIARKIPPLGGLAARERDPKSAGTAMLTLPTRYPWRRRHVTPLTKKNVHIYEG